MNQEIVYLGITKFRNQETKFGIKLEDRRRHFYIIGKTGMGKTTLLENMAIQDVLANRGLAVIDPHGGYAERLLDFIPKERIKDTIYFDPSDIAYPIGFNVMEDVDPDLRYLVASGVVGAFKKIWAETWGPRLEYLLRNSVLALLEYPGATLLSIMRLLIDKEYRKKVVETIKDPIVKTFWQEEFPRYPDRFQAEAVAPIQNKVGQYITSPLIRNIIGQEHSVFNFREIMDNGKILIVNLSKGKIGEDNAALLGAMLITKLQLAAMSRVDLPEEERKDFYLYVDEFQNFATESFANILSEARKYRLNLILAHQYIAQVPEVVREAIFGNVGSIVVFRVGAEDAEFLEKEFSPEFEAADLCNLSRFEIYLRLMIDGMTSRPFSAVTLPPFPLPKKTYKEEVIQYTREHYAKKREEVERKISQEWLKEEEKKYRAYCWLCGKEVEVPFLPDNKRPVYCPECFKKIQRKEVVPPSSPLKPVIERGEVISLEELKEKTLPETKPKERKPTPDLESLKEVLRKSLEKSFQRESSETSEEELLEKEKKEEEKEGENKKEK